MPRYFLILVIFSLVQINGFSQTVKIHYLGHSAFVLHFDDLTVLTDYGKPNAWKQWGWDSPIYSIGELIPDIITYSHLHEDHYDPGRIPEGVKHILKDGNELEFQDLRISAIPTCEDKFGEFNNHCYKFSYKDYTVIHTGDIQTMIANNEDHEIAEYFKRYYPQNIDLLIMPIEGKIKYIRQAEEFIRLVKPKVVIPTHAWTKEYLNEFISYINSKNKYNLQVIDSPSYKLSSSSQNGLIQIIVLNKSKYLDN